MIRIAADHRPAAVTRRSSGRTGGATARARTRRAASRRGRRAPGTCARPRRASAITSRSRARFPTRSVGIPACRVPATSPGAAQFEVLLGDREAVVRRGDRLAAAPRPRATAAAGRAARSTTGAPRARPARAAGAAATARTAPRAPPPSPSRSARRSRPRRPSSTPGSGSRPAANCRITASFACGVIRPCSRPTRQAGKTSCARWSAISVAARRSIFSDSSTSG